MAETLSQQECADWRSRLNLLLHNASLGTSLRWRQEVRALATIDRLRLDEDILMVTLGRVVGKPAPFCEEKGVLTCPYCEGTSEHLDDCDWLVARNVYVGIRNRPALGGDEKQNN